MDSSSHRWLSVLVAAATLASACTHKATSPVLAVAEPVAPIAFVPPAPPPAPTEPAPALVTAPTPEPAPAATLAVDELAGFLATAEGVADAADAAWQEGNLTPIAVDCLDGDPTAALSLAADVDATRPGDERVLVSLPYGVIAILGRAPLELAAFAEPLASCAGSQTELLGAWAGQIVADADAEIVVLYTEGGRNMNATTLEVLKRQGGALASILRIDVRAAEGDVETRRRLELVALDAMVARVHGQADAQLLWDAAAFAFVPR